MSMGEPFRRAGSENQGTPEFLQGDAELGRWGFDAPALCILKYEAAAREWGLLQGPL